MSGHDLAGCGKTHGRGGFVSGHDLAGCGKTHGRGGFVSGHDLGRAENAFIFGNASGLQPPSASISAVFSAAFLVLPARHLTSNIERTLVRQRAPQMPSMKTITVSDLRKQCSRVLDRAVRTKQSVCITRFGKLIGLVVPHVTVERSKWIGSMNNPIRILGDIVSSANRTDEWEILRV